MAETHGTIPRRSSRFGDRELCRTPPFLLWRWHRIALDHCVNLIHNMGKITSLCNPASSRFLMFQDGRAILVDAQTGLVLSHFYLSRMANTLSAILIETDSTVICVYSANGVDLEAVDVVRAKEVWRLKCPNDITFLDYNDARKTVFVGDCNNSMLALNVERGIAENITNGVVRRWTLDSISSVQINPDGFIRLERNNQRIVLGHASDVATFPRVFSNGRHLVISLQHSGIACYDALDGTRVWENRLLPGRVEDVLWSGSLGAWLCVVVPSGDFAGYVVKISQCGKEEVLDLFHPNGLERIDARLCSRGDYLVVLPNYCVEIKTMSWRKLICISDSGDIAV